MKRISTKLIILLVSAALVPLLLFAIFSIMASRTANYRSVSEGNLNVAKGAADQIELYVQNGIQILKGISENVNRIHLVPWQKETIIKNYIINFEQFHEIYLTDRKGLQIATTDLGAELTDRSKARCASAITPSSPGMPPGNTRTHGDSISAARRKWSRMPASAVRRTLGSAAFSPSVPSPA